MKTSGIDHVMDVQEPWFSHIQSGTKTIEGRKNRTWTKLKVGDQIRMVNGLRSFVVKVMDVRRYGSVRKYLENEGLEPTLPGIATVDEGIRIYRQWSTKEEIEKHGFLAIEVKVL